MLGRVRWLKRLLLDLPRHAKLTYCLALDPRVPTTHKAALAAALGLIVTPFVDVPMWVPVVGEMDAIALSLVAARVFIATAPAHVVEEHTRLIREGRSRFDRDLQEGQRAAVVLARHLGLGGPRAPVVEREFVGRAVAGKQPVTEVGA